MTENKFVVSSTPHIRSSASIESIMKDVLIALMPATLAAAYFFGFRAVAVVLLTMASCVLAEWLYQKAAKQPITVNDYSAMVTGLLLALNLPASVPFWMPIVGGFFAIIVVKQLFGGLGQNFMNPALAARAFLQTAYPAQMVAWTEPVRYFAYAGTDAVTGATPLGVSKMTEFVPASSDYINAFIGNISGSMGETCAVALLLGGLYLIVRKVISWRIPAAYLLTFGALSFFLGRHGLFTGFPFYELIVGGILIGAFFMATDYSSSPITARGQLIMGVGCGILTYVIRTYGGYPEGVCYSILLMNLFVPLIDRFTKPQVYGVSKGGVKRA